MHFLSWSNRPQVDLRYPIRSEKLQRLGWRAETPWAEGIRQTGSIIHPMWNDQSSYKAFMIEVHCFLYSRLDGQLTITDKKKTTKNQKQGMIHFGNEIWKIVWKLFHVSTYVDFPKSCRNLKIWILFCHCLLTRPVFCALVFQWSGTKTTQTSGWTSIRTSESERSLKKPQTHDQA